MTMLKRTDFLTSALASSYSSAQRWIQLLNAVHVSAFVAPNPETLDKLRYSIQPEWRHYSKKCSQIATKLDSDWQILQDLSVAWCKRGALVPPLTHISSFSTEDVENIGNTDLSSLGLLSEDLKVITSDRDWETERS